MDEVGDVNSHIVFGGERDLLPHTTLESTTPLNGERTGVKNTLFGFAETPRQRGEEHDEHQHECLDLSLSHSPATPRPMLNSTVSTIHYASHDSIMIR